jgi:DNA modification methylase
LNRAKKPVDTRNIPGLKPKDLCGIPWRVAFALQADGWYLRSDIIWSKPNPMPESVTNRPTKAHEYLFLLSKQERYYYDADAISEPATYPAGSGNTHPYLVPNQRNGENANLGGGLHLVGPREMRNKRSVWTVPTAPYAEAHFATYPPDLIKPCILAGSRPGSTILDPFAGSGTTGAVAIELARKAILIELNPAYIPLIERRCSVTPGFAL